jgi:hypothetical protein
MARMQMRLEIHMTFKFWPHLGKHRMTATFRQAPVEYWNKGVQQHHVGICGSNQHVAARVFVGHLGPKRVGSSHSVAKRV